MNRRRSAFTVVEAIIASVVGCALFILVFSLFLPAQRNGARLEEKLQGVHGAALLVAYLDTDLAQAERVVAAGDRLTISRYIERDRFAKEYGVREDVTWSLDSEGRVERKVETTTPAGVTAASRNRVGSLRWATLGFAREGQRVRLTADERSRVTGAKPAKVDVAVLSPIADRPANFWASAEAQEAGADPVAASEPAVAD